MGSVKVGSAYAEFRLETKGFRQDILEVQKGLKGLQAASKIPPLALPTAPVKQYGDTAQRAGQQALTLAQAQARLLVTQGDTAGAFNRLSTALVGVERNSLAAIRAQTQLAQISKKLAQETNGSSGVLGKIGPQVLQMAGAFGVATTAVGVAVGTWNQVSTGFNLVATIDANRRSLGAFLGDQERANKVFADGAAFAERYKIKQSEIGQAQQGLAPLLKTSTTETEKQLEVLTRLQSLNSRASFGDAAFSVKELASGDYMSIADQFNLGKAAAQRLRDEVAAGADVFAVLDAELNRIGATTAVLDQRTQGAAGAQAAYAKATEDLQIAIGQLVTGPGTGLLNFFAQAARDANAFIQLVNGSQGQELAAGIFAASTSYEQYTAAVQASNAAQRELVAAKDPLGALFGLYPQVQQLTQAQYVYAQSLIATGTATTEAEQRALEFGANVGAVATSADPAIAGLGQRLLALAQQGGGAEEAAFNLALAFQENGLSAEQLGSQLTIVESQTTAAAAAAAEGAAADQAAAAAKAEATAQAEAYASAISLESGALAENLAKTVESEIQTNLLAQAQGQLASLGSQVAGGLLTAAQAAGQLAAQYGIASGEAMRLIQLQATLARTKAVANAGFSGVPEAYLGAAIGGRAGGSTLGPSTAVLDQIAKETKAADAKYQAAIREAEAAARKAGSGGGGKPKGGGGGKTEAERAAEKQAKAEESLGQKLLDIKDRYYDAAAKAEEAHQEKVLSIQERYIQAQLKAQRKLQVDSLGSKADFYEALLPSELPADIQQSLSAAYEAAFAESQRLSQEGKAALASDYLDLKSEQLSAELEYQQAVAEARNQAAEGDKAEQKKAQERLQRLEAIKKLRDQEFQAKESNLFAEGDENVAERDQGLTEADRERQEALGKAAATAGDALSDAQRRGADAAAAHNLVLQEQIAQLTTIGRLGGIPTSPLADVASASVGRNLATTPAAAPAAASATPAAAAAEPAQANGPVLVDAPALAAQVASLSATVERLAGTVEAQQATLGRIATSTADTARKVGSGRSGT